jgi:hypothetical protein
VNAASALTLRSGPPRRIGAIALSVLALVFLGTKLVAVAQSGQVGDRLPGVVVAAAMFAAMLYVLCVNLLHREVLTIVRDRARVPARGSVIADDDIVRVELLERPAYGSHGWGVFCLGLSPGLLVLHTRDGESVRFGAGQGEEQALAHAARIERFRTDGAARA